MAGEALAATEVFKALGDPIRWSIVQQMATCEELACSTLEDTLPVSKPTISYHTKILTQAGLIEVRKRGRNYFYSLRREVLRALVLEVWSLAPGLRLLDDDDDDVAAVAAVAAVADMVAPSPVSAVAGAGAAARPARALGR